MGLGARMQAGWLFLIHHSLNKLTGRIARRGSRRFSIVRTVGRKSGRIFETPIIGQPVDGGFMVELTYGPQVNWYQNLIAGGGGEIIRQGVTTRVLGPVPVTASEGLAAFPPWQRALLRLMRKRHFAKLPVA
jgi:deazaflavin-dependent oxidoreductase (nitroreductase family)